MPKKRVLAAAVTLALGVPSFNAQPQSIANTALPTGGQVVGGQAAISQSGAAMRIDQSSSRAAIDWQSFNIGAGASVTFNQPSSSAIALNRVLGTGGSEIYGRLSANGQVFLTNPNGVLFGRGAQVDVGGLVASTLGMSAEDFMLGRYSLRAQGSAGSVVNQGTIRANGGSVALVAPQVVNDGLIEAQHGAISLTAANAATVDLLADGLVRIRVDEGALQAEIANHGVLRADGGSITLTARSVDNLARAVVNNTGIIEARTVEDINGVVRLSGGDVTVSGTIDVSSTEGVGGSAHVLGERVALVGNARIDASGALGGGEVLIGGDLGGRNPEIQNAQYTYIGPDASVRADAVRSGDGGKVIAWADEATQVYGLISVRGGATSGNGGFVETSGKRYLDVRQAPDITAVNGRGGTWLLDPETISIEAGADFNITLPSPFQPGLLTLPSILNIGTLTNALDQGGTVIVDTTNLLGLSAGDINVNAPITKTSGSTSTLQLLAHNDININQNITSSNNALNLVLNANQDGSGGGQVNIANNVTLNTAGGTINASAETVNIGSATIVAPLFSAGTLNLSPGTLTLTGDVNVSGALNWSGGLMTGAGKTLVRGPLAITGSIGLDAGRVLDVQGGANWISGTIDLNPTAAVGSGVILNAAGSIFTTDVDGQIFTRNFGANDDGRAARFDNLGTFRKTGGGSAGTTIGTVFNNTGSVDLRVGTLSLQQDGTHAGSFSVASGAKLQFAGGIHALNNATGFASQGHVLVNGGIVNTNGVLTSAGLLELSAGTLNAGAAINTAAYTQSGGTLAGSGDLTVAGTTTLSGGTMTGPGRTITRGALAITGSIALDAGRILDIGGDATWSAGSINLNATSAIGSGSIVNSAGAKFSTSFDGLMFTQNFGAGDDGTSASFNNFGTFQKTGGIATTAIANAFNNSGTLDVQSGTVWLQQGGTHAGSFVGAGTLQFGGGTHVLTSTSSVTVANATFSAGTADVGGTYNIAGTTTVSGGTAAFTGTLTSLGSALNITSGVADLRGANATVASFTQSGGTLAGTSSLMVSGASTLSGGTMTGTGSTITAGPLAITGSISLDAGRVLDVRGGATWTAGSINLNPTSAAGAGSIINRVGSTFSTSFDGTMFSQNFGTGDDGTSALFDNLGTFQKTGGTGATSIASRFNNTGALDVRSGTVNLQQGGTHAGSFAGTGTVQFGGGAHLLASTSSVTVANATFSGGTADVGGIYNIAGTTTVNGGTASFTGTLASLGNALDITSGVADLRGAAATVATFTQSGGTLSGTSSLTVSGGTTLSGGNMSGSGSTITRGPLAITGSIALDAGRVLDVQGGATWTAGSINFNSGSAPGSGTIVNRAGSTFSTSFDGTMFTQNFGATDTGTAAVFDNLGTLQKTGGAGSTSIASRFNNAGTLTVQSGTVNLQQGGTHAGSFGGAGTIAFGGGTHILGATSVVNAANVNFSGGSVDIGGSYASGTTSVSAGTANFIVAAQTSNLIQSGGTLSGAGAFTVSGSSMLSGGTMSGTGTTLAYGPMAITGSIALDAGRVLDIHGDVDWTAGSIDLNASGAVGAGTIINRGTFTTRFAGSMFTQNFGTGDNGTSALFENRGTFLHTASGTTSIQNVFDNHATLDVRSGTVNLQQGGTHSGDFAIGSGATLQFSGGTHNIAGTSVQNSSGRLLVAGGTLNIGGSLANQGLLEVTAGALDVSGAATTVSYQQSGGTLSGAGALTVSGAANLSGGTMTGSGSTITQGTLAISGPIALDAGRVLDIQGGAAWTAGTINLNASGAAGSGTIVNRAGSIFTTSFDGSMFTQNFGASDNGSSALFNNLGTFQKSAGTGSTTVQAAFTNAGALSVDAGSLRLTTFPSNAGTITVSNGASLVLNASLTNTASGVISGDGTIDLGSATLTNDGMISAGASIGTLDIVGNLALGATGVVRVDVRDPWTSAGRDFDLINVSGSAALGGTLQLNHADALVPAGGQLMQVISAGAVSGTFASVTVPASSSYSALYNPANVTVRHDIAVVPPPVVIPPPVVETPAPLPPTVSAGLGFEPSTVGTTPVPSVGSEITQVAAAAAPLVAVSTTPAFVMPDLSHIMASMSELRRKKVDAVEDAVRILERNPNAADLPACAGAPSGGCIAERPARLEPGKSAEGATPELAHLWGIERKYALLIGVNEYRDPIPQLGSPLKDIEEIAALYRSQFGYEVRTLANADKASIVREINRLILETGPNDSVVVFYAGHGHVVEKTGRGYWIPAKAGGDDPKQWISNSDVAKMLANIPARQVLLVSDSCYSGTLAKESRIEKSEVLADPRAVLERRAVTVLTSGGDEPVADKGKDGHSVFAWHFIRTLGRVAQWSSGVDVYERLAENVQLDFPQTPQYGAALGAGHETGADYLFEVRRY